MSEEKEKNVFKSQLPVSLFNKADDVIFISWTIDCLTIKKGGISNL